MKLHRSIGKPDWEKISADRYNIYQKIAALTHGWITPGNIATMFGFGSVIAGLIAISFAHHWLGLWLLLEGRLFDIIDGWVADRTGTKSPLGETLDAGFDKLITVLTIVVLYTSHVAPPWALLLLVGPHVLIGIITAGYMLRGEHLHPSQLGKLGMGAAWLCLIGLLFIKAADVSNSSFIVTFVYITIGVSFSISMRAAIEYLHHNQRKLKKKAEEKEA